VSDEVWPLSRIEAVHGAEITAEAAGRLDIRRRWVGEIDYFPGP
jgi:hypothetical protein